jgi:hypothetical protein
MAGLDLGEQGLHERDARSQHPGGHRPREGCQQHQPPHPRLELRPEEPWEEVSIHVRRNSQAISTNRVTRMSCLKPPPDTIGKDSLPGTGKYPRSIAKVLGLTTGSALRILGDSIHTTEAL